MYIHPKLWTKGFPFPPSLIFLACFILSLLPSPLLSQFLFLPIFFYPNSHQLPLGRFPPHPVLSQWSITNSSPMQCDARQLWVQSVFTLLQASGSVSSCSVCFMCSTNYKMHTAAGLFSCQWVRSSMYWMLKHEAKQLNSFVCFGTLSLCVVFKICSLALH